MLDGKRGAVLPLPAADVPEKVAADQVQRPVEALGAGLAQVHAQLQSLRAALADVGAAHGLGGDAVQRVGLSGWLVKQHLVHSFVPPLSAEVHYTRFLSINQYLLRRGEASHETGLWAGVVSTVRNRCRASVLLGMPRPYASPKSRPMPTRATMAPTAARRLTRSPVQAAKGRMNSGLVDSSVWAMPADVSLSATCCNQTAR